MSRSYRKPYWPITGHSSSQDKLDGRRSVRRREKQSIKQFQVTSLEWDEFLIPERYECANNEVWCWSRDGKQTLQGWYHNCFNIYWVVSRYNRRTVEELIEDRNERVERHARYLDKLKRK